MRFVLPPYLAGASAADDAQQFGSRQCSSATALSLPKAVDRPEEIA
jgi:hypothetical protein